MTLHQLLREAKLQGGGQMSVSGTVIEALVLVVTEARRVQISEIGLMHLADLDELILALGRLKKTLKGAK